MAAILSRPQCVNSKGASRLWWILYDILNDEIWSMSGYMESLMQFETFKKTDRTVRNVPAYGLAPNSARTSAGTGMIKWVSQVYIMAPTDSDVSKLKNFQGPF